MKFLILSLLFNVAYAQNAVVIKKGDPAPFDGVLFTKTYEKELRQQKLDLEYAEKKIVHLSQLNELNNKELDILTKRFELQRNRAQEMADRESKAESQSAWKNALYFVSGALVTGIIGYGVIQAYR